MPVREDRYWNIICRTIFLLSLLVPGSRLDLNEVSPEQVQEDLATHLAITCSTCKKVCITIISKLFFSSI